MVPAPPNDGAARAAAATLASAIMVFGLPGTISCGTPLMKAGARRRFDPVGCRLAWLGSAAAIGQSYSGADVIDEQLFVGAVYLSH
jgi:hypothetical protein